MAEKKKKNFKSLTGIKFADLIMPLMMGGIGSYSPAAGRGVGLGLQAFRTFQAGQEFGDEREAKKKMTEFYEQDIENQRQHLEQIRQGKIDPSEVEHAGFYDKRGPATPVGSEEVERAGTSPGQFSLFGDDDTDLSGEVDLDRGGEISGAMGEPDQLLTDALVAKKSSQEATARDIEIAEGRMRFSQLGAATALTSPGTAGYMGMQEQAGRISNQEDVAKMIRTTKMWEDNAVRRNKLTEKEIRLRGGEERETMRLRAELDSDYQFFNTSEGMVYADPARLKRGLNPFVHESRGPIDIMDLPFEDKWEMWDKTVSSYQRSVKQQRELGEDTIDTGMMKDQRDTIAALYAAMTSTSDDLVKFTSILQQKNAELQQAGLPPLTMEDYLRSIGIKYGPGGIPIPGTGAGENGSPVTDKDRAAEVEESYMDALSGS